MPIQLTKILKLLIILFVPIFLVGGSVRLMANDPYLAFEYGKTSFPPDESGFTAQQRYDLASVNIHYVRSHLPDDALSTQTLSGTPVYNQREVSHMVDVRGVFQAVFRVWQITLILILLLGFILWRYRERTVLASAIQSGGLLTSVMIVSIASLAIFGWEFWFNTFHLFFFKPSSWLFSYSDTLIRLFPVEFWFDATLTISVLSLAGGLLLAFIGWLGKRVLAKKQV